MVAALVTGKGMKRCLLSVVTASLLLGTGMPARAASTARASIPSMIYAHPPQERIDPLAYPQFMQIEAELRNTVRRHGDRSVPNRFCAVGYRLKSGTLETVLLWDNAQSLIRWQGGDPAGVAEEDAESASFSPVTDLRSDVVEDGSFPLGTRAVMRTDVEALIADCRRFGRQYTVPPSP